MMEEVKKKKQFKTLQNIQTSQSLMYGKTIQRANRF